MQGKILCLLFAVRPQHRLGKAGVGTDRTHRHLSCLWLFLPLKMIHLNVVSQINFVLSVKRNFVSKFFNANDVLMFHSLIFFP